ncbi:C40 family peptidase [Daejeonia sp. YH14]|uniref:C40 family peptidase n=1 Tax=Daejeonia sp. YH14 TaxID=3439042 RepID=UPI003F490F1E
MKKRVLFYLTVMASALSLQSCVSNYVVSSPITYKTNAKLASIPTGDLNELKTEINGNSIDAKLATLEKVNKAVEKSQKDLYNDKIKSLLEEADSYIGTPYRFGGMTRNGIDCSAFVLSVFGSTLGMQLPRVAAAQAQEGESIDRSELKKGDLVFFSHSRRISHVGIVHDVKENGEVDFIHAATSKGVMISSLDDSYWGPKFRYAKRIINTQNTSESTSDHSALAKNSN